MLTQLVDGCTCLAASPPNEFTLRDLNKGIVSFSSPVIIKLPTGIFSHFGVVGNMGFLMQPLLLEEVLI